MDKMLKVLRTYLVDAENERDYHDEDLRRNEKAGYTGWPGKAEATDNRDRAATCVDALNQAIAIVEEVTRLREQNGRLRKVLAQIGYWEQHFAYEPSSAELAHIARAELKETSHG